MIEFEKQIIAVITNHLQPFVDKVHRLLSLFKDLDCTKNDMKEILNDYIQYQLQVLLMKLIFGFVLMVVVILGVLVVSMATN